MPKSKSASPPPLPNEPPPLPTEQPPLPNEAPPLPTEAPPLPTEAPPLPTEQPPKDQPIQSLETRDDDDDVDDDIEHSPDVAESSKAKGKEAASDADTSQPWQAVWSAEQNAWYFWNTVTGAVTWTNPLQQDATATQPPLPAGPPPTSDAPRSTFSPGVPGIDPDLAYLLPPDQRGGSSSDPGAQSAAFNARTGKFTVDNSYRFDHLDEYNRQKRMSEHYFDMEAWEKQRQDEHRKRKLEEASGVVRDTKVTKQDMERFKKKKAEQKWRKQAWLRD